MSRPTVTRWAPLRPAKYCPDLLRPFDMPRPAETHRDPLLNLKNPLIETWDWNMSIGNHNEPNKCFYPYVWYLNFKFQSQIIKSQLKHLLNPTCMLIATMVLVWMAETRELILNLHTQKLLNHNYIIQYLIKQIPSQISRQGISIF